MKELNERLASVRTRLNEHRARFAITERLARDHELSLYKATFTEVQRGARTHLSVSLDREEAQWRRRRRHDGFVHAGDAAAA